MRPVDKWVLICYKDCAFNLISVLISEATKLNYQIPQHPVKQYTTINNAPCDYIRELDVVMNTYKNTIQLVLVILPKYSEDVWSEVYQRASVYFGEFGVATQCVDGGLLNMPNTNVSVCRNLVIKINAKLGGVPWTVNIASETTMFVGFAFYRSKNGNRVIGMVASIDKTCSKYFSTASFHPANMPLYSAEIGEHLKKCLNAYRDKTKMLPNSIIMYRTEICDWQRYKVYGIELKAMKVAISDVYKNARLSEPTLTVIMPSKQSNSRFFSQVRHEIYANPRAGTVIDGNITSPGRYNFYLLSHVCTESQHTATPTSYSVLCDPEGLNPENLLQHRRKIQLLTFKLCHLYYNCCSTVALPAPYKYAQDLVDFIGKYLKGAIPPDNLSHDLYYL
ncbi:unnamed protein product [Orchesella dallaii]|uniref:Piwi domain-containing protein n=1 Tax=Orchesella dallaii TaxID=48710 RepID=A0ABP1PW86_9HEXA